MPQRGENDFQRWSVPSKRLNDWEDATDEEDVEASSSDDADEEEDFYSDYEEDGTVEVPDNRLGDQYAPAPAPRRHSTTADEEIALATIRLANEVEELRRRRSELVSLQLSRMLTTSRRDHMVTTALEYYDTFRNGFLSRRVPSIMEFLSARIDHDVFTYGANSSHNADTLIEQWRRYTRMLPSISIRVQATTCTHLVDPSDHRSFAATASDPTQATCLVEAQGSMSGIISQHTIRTAFPHLLHRHDLMHKLLGKPLDCPISLRFFFNGAGRVIRLDFHADFFAGFGAVPGVGLLELSQIMEKAIVGENCIIPEVPEVDGDEGGSSEVSVAH